MKWFYSILVAILLLAACDDEVQTPKLVGKWQLKTVEKNEIITPVDTVWYNFQSEAVFSIQVYVPQQDTVLMLRGMKTQTDKTLSIQLESGAYNEYTDWYGTNRSFTIDKLERKSLVLRSEDASLYTFRKF